MYFDKYINFFVLNSNIFLIYIIIVYTNIDYIYK